MFLPVQQAPALFFTVTSTKLQVKHVALIIPWASTDFNLQKQTHLSLPMSPWAMIPSQLSSSVPSFGVEEEKPHCWLSFHQYIMGYTTPCPRAQTLGYVPDICQKGESKPRWCVVHLFLSRSNSQTPLELLTVLLLLWEFVNAGEILNVNS